MKKSFFKYITIFSLVAVLSFGAMVRSNTTVEANETFKFGAEVLLSEQKDLLKGKRVGLVTNPTGIDQNFNSVVDMLFNDPEIELTALYGPEHGVRGNAQAGAYVDFYIDPVTQIPVYSIYGKTRKPSPEMLADVDVLLFDIQDAGVTYYTYIWSMYYVMEAAAENGKEVIILDRPNPLGDYVGGPVIIDPGMSSFVGLKDLPVIHGMTFGELAKYFVEEYQLDVKLTVVEMANYDRTLKYDELNVPFVLPSPNMPTTDTVNVYPVTGFFESFTNVSEGRGTTKPFELIGAVFMDSTEYARELNKLNLKGVKFRAAAFTPVASKLEKQLAQGVEVYVTNPHTYDPIKTGLHMIETMIKLYPNDVQWRTDQWLGKLTGKAYIETDLKAGVPVDEIIAKWQDELETFKVKREKYLIYNRAQTPDPVTYKLVAEDFSLTLDEAEMVKHSTIIEKSKAMASSSDNSAATVVVLENEIKHLPGKYKVTLSVKEDESIKQDIYVTVLEAKQEEVLEYTLVAEDFTLTSKEVLDITDEALIEKAKAKATASDDSIATVVVKEHNLKNEAGTYTLVLSVSEDSSKQIEVKVTVTGEKIEKVPKEDLPKDEIPKVEKPNKVVPNGKLPATGIQSNAKFIVGGSSMMVLLGVYLFKRKG